MNSFASENSLEKRIELHLKNIGEIGVSPKGAAEGGWTRLAFSDEEDRVHEYARAVFGTIEYGLESSTDEFGNLFGKTATAVRDVECTMIGTHLDTVVEGGNFDGVVGFIVAVEALRLLKQEGEEAPPLWIAIFRAEESTRFKKSCLGSRAAFLGLDEETLELGYKDETENVVSLKESLSRLGEFAIELESPTLDPGLFSAYYETHIEQARVLEAEQKQRQAAPESVANRTLEPMLGIVESIRAPHRCEWEIVGKDGAAAWLLAVCVLEVEKRAEIAASSGLDIVATVGRVDSFVEGADKINAVPGNVRIPVTPDISARIEWTKDIARINGCEVSVEEDGDQLYLKVSGITDHSGGAPMGKESRKDALSALSRILLELPSSCLLVPERIVFYTDVRSADKEARSVVMNAIEVAFQGWANFARAAEATKGGVGSIRLEKIRRTEFGEPIRAMDQKLRERLRLSADSLGLANVALPSGAGHDAMIAAQAGIPSALMFIPSIDGLSHNPGERSRTLDIAAAVRVQAHALKSHTNH